MAHCSLFLVLQPAHSLPQLSIVFLKPARPIPQLLDRFMSADVDALRALEPGLSRLDLRGGLLLALCQLVRKGLLDPPDRRHDAPSFLSGRLSLG